MNSGILDSFGISDPGILIVIMLVLVIVLFVLLIFLLVRYNQLNESYQMFMKGRKAESLEEEIGTLFDDISNLKTSTEKNRKDIKKIIENLRETYQRVGIVKYDAFKEMGGKLSFSVALLNDNETGFFLPIAIRNSSNASSLFAFFISASYKVSSFNSSLNNTSLNLSETNTLTASS